MIRLSSVRKVFNADKPSECIALDDVTLDIEPGKITAFRGPSVTFPKSHVQAAT